MATELGLLSPKRREQLGFNPNRTIDLFALTHDGYIIAQDIASQHEYVLDQRTEEGFPIMPIAHINRSFQGLSEIVAICGQNGERFSFIFDISNTVYQDWLQDQMGELYEVNYEGSSRKADPKQRYFTD